MLVQRGVVYSQLVNIDECHLESLAHSLLNLGKGMVGLHTVTRHLIINAYL